MARTYRVKCPKCGEVINLPGTAPCPKCGTPIDVALPGLIQIYRMGNFIGSMAGYGIYLNDMPLGHIGDRETVLIPVPYGTYKLHMTCGMNRRCNDPVFEINPQDPYVCVKAHIKMGAFTNKIVVERVTPDTMPQV